MPKPVSVVSLDPIDRKKKIGVIGRLLITTYHRGEKPKKTLPFGHYMFCGEQRQGKSSSFIWYAEYLAKRLKKRRLRHAVDGKLIKFDEPPKVKLFSNIGVGTPFKRDELHDLIDKLDPYANEVRIFLVDEIHTYFPKEGTTKKEKEEIAALNAVFSQLGKRNTFVLSTAQVYGRLDKALREQCLYMVNCYIHKFSGKIVNEFIPQKDILVDDLGRWAGRPKRIMQHGLPKLAYDTKKLIRE